MKTSTMLPANNACETSSVRNIEYLSPPAGVSMADRWFQIAALDHFWIRRRFEGYQRLAGGLVTRARGVAEIGCGPGLFQRQNEDDSGRGGTRIHLEEQALKQNISRIR